MPRACRSIVPDVIYHVINRGNGRQTIFHKDGDYLAFLKVLAQAHQRTPIDILAYCLMPNHWHLVLRPASETALGRFIGWLCTTHVRRHHEHYQIRGGGHLYQGRFKNFPVQDDYHLLTVLRYVEANARRAGLVERAEDWPWSSASARSMIPRIPMAMWPVNRPGNWLELLNEPLAESSLVALRHSLQRGKPFGQNDWVERLASSLGITCSLRPRGRPKKHSQPLIQQFEEPSIIEQ
jgi:putative transposase